MAKLLIEVDGLGTPDQDECHLCPHLLWPEGFLPYCRIFRDRYNRGTELAVRYGKVYRNCQCLAAEKRG